MKNSFSETDKAKIEKIQKEKGIKSFTETVRTIVREYTDGGSLGLSDENFALLADAIVEMDKKIDLIINNLPAPKSAGEVK
jgi:hypothetical protein